MTALGEMQTHEMAAKASSLSFEKQIASLGTSGFGHLSRNASEVGIHRKD